MWNRATTRRAQRGIFREWRLHALSVFSLAVAFVCLGSALLVVTNLSALHERWERAGRASVYLTDRAEEAEVDTVRSTLLRVPGVSRVTFVSREQARQSFAEREAESGSGFRALPQESFPQSLEVEVSEEMSDADLSEMAGKLRQLPQVEDVETYKAWTKRLAELVRGGVTASFLLALVVLFAVLAVVGSTIRLALQRRKTEVEVLKLVGATDGFVRGPFVLEGGLQGAVGALLALILLFGMFLVLRGKLDGELTRLVGMEPHFLAWTHVLLLIAGGAVLGAGAAFASLRRLLFASVRDA